MLKEKDYTKLGHSVSWRSYYICFQFINIISDVLCSVLPNGLCVTIKVVLSIYGYTGLMHLIIDPIKLK